MKSVLVLLALSCTFSAFAQWTHPGEEPSNQIDCSSTYHSWDLPECEEHTRRMRAEDEYRYGLILAKKAAMEADENYLENLRSMPGCQKADPYSKKLSKMNEAELCRRQLTDKLQAEGYFKHIEETFGK